MTVGVLAGLTFQGVFPFPQIKVAALSPIDFWKLSATDGTYGSNFWFAGFDGLIQGQIYNPATEFSPNLGQEDLSRSRCDSDFVDLSRWVWEQFFCAKFP